MFSFNLFPRRNTPALEITVKSIVMLLGSLTRKPVVKMKPPFYSVKVIAKDMVLK